MERTCPNCERGMLLLFTSYVCDYCENPPSGGFYLGYILSRADEPLPRPEYVFRTIETAKRWRELRDLAGCRVREVLSPTPIRWRVSRGAVTGLEIADRRYEVHSDHRFAPGIYQAFLFPDESENIEILDDRCDEELAGIDHAM